MSIGESFPAKPFTPRLLLRRFAAGDLTDFLAYQTHPEVLRFMPDLPMETSQAAEFLMQQMALKEAQRGNYHAFAVYHLADKKVIGDVGLFLAEGAENCGDLGFQFHPDYQGKGYASEAVRALLRHAFLKWELARITSACDARNFASYRLMERVGMRKEGHMIKSRITKGERHDVLIYALLREEFPEDSYGE